MGKAHFGLIGLGVMGENLVLNAERNGYSSVVFNRTKAKTDEFLAGRGLHHGLHSKYVGTYFMIIWTSHKSSHHVTARHLAPTCDSLRRYGGQAPAPLALPIGKKPRTVSRPGLLLCAALMSLT